MTVSRSTAGTLYRERPRCPFWVWLAFFLVAGTVAYLPFLLFYAFGARDLRTGALFLLPVPLLVSLLPVFSRLSVQVDEASVRIGRFFTIPLVEITATRPVSGDALKQIRHEMMDLDTPTDNATLLNLVPGFALVGSGLSAIAWGYRAMQAENRRNGMHCSPWQEPALLVETPGLPTHQWLIAAADPAGLQGAIDKARRNRMNAGGIPSIQ